MKKTSKILAPLALLMAIGFPAYAQEVSLTNQLTQTSASVSNDDDDPATEIVIKKGDGYEVTAPKNHKQHKKVDNLPGGKPKKGSRSIGILSTTTKSMSTNTTDTFSGSTYDYPFGGSDYIKDASSVTTTNEHNLTGSDYQSTNGKQSVFWSGSSPFDADSINMIPSQQFTGTAKVLGFSYPSSVSYGTSGFNGIFSWPEVSISNNYKGTYTFSTVKCSTTGHFTYMTENDNASWLFGTDAYGQINTVRVSIS